jgi:hypothetical protein
MVGIEQQLDGNIIDGLYAANTPSTSNPIATMADVGEGIPPFADERQFLSVFNFDSGSLPVGWTGSVSGTGSTIVYTQASEPGTSPGLALATLTTTALGRVSIVMGSGFQYMRTFIDGPETVYFIQMRWSGIPSPTNCAQILGWVNQNAFTPVSAMGNALGIMYDPSNVSGFNTGLITNLFLIARSTYNGPTGTTVVDLGIPYDATNWRSYKIVYDNVLSEVRVYRDNVLLTTLTNMANVPAGSVRGLIPAAANNGLASGFYIGNGAVAAATGTAIRVSKVSVFKRYS